MSSDKLRAWYQASRPPFYIATFIPLTAGWMLAVRDGALYQTGLFLLINIFAVMVHFATNLANDYFDHVQGADAGASIGGSRALQDGKLTIGELRTSLWILYTGAAAMAAGYMWLANMWILSPLVVFAIFSSLYYTAPPIRYGYIGLGELFAGINMGPVMVVGTQWIIAGSPSTDALLVSLPIGMMVAGILYYQSMPDMETDASAGKRTITVRLGQKWAYNVLILQWVTLYTLILGLAANRIISPIAIASILTVPILVKLLKLIPRIQDWQELNSHGHYIRKLYLINGLIIVLAVRL